MTTNYDIDDLFYHVEFEDCVLVQAFVTSLEDSLSGQCFLYSIFWSQSYFEVLKFIVGTDSELLNEENGGVV